MIAVRKTIPPGPWENFFCSDFDPALRGRNHCSFLVPRPRAAPFKGRAGLQERIELNRVIPKMVFLFNQKGQLGTEFLWVGFGIRIGEVEFGPPVPPLGAIFDRSIPGDVVLFGPIQQGNRGVKNAFAFV